MGNCCDSRIASKQYRSNGDHLINDDSCNQVKHPTLENLLMIYKQGKQPGFDDNNLRHPKEQMIFMIINLLRSNPQQFMYQLNELKRNACQRRKRHQIVLDSQDYDNAIDVLKNVIATHPLKIRSYGEYRAVNLSSVRNITSNKIRKLSLSDMDNQTTKLDSSVYSLPTEEAEEDTFKAKKMQIEFKCWQALTITTLKEFLEAFVISVKKNAQFHIEILSDKYQYVSLQISFMETTQVATLKIILQKF